MTIKKYIKLVQGCEIVNSIVIISRIILWLLLLSFVHVKNAYNTREILKSDSYGQGLHRNRFGKMVLPFLSALKLFTFTSKQPSFSIRSFIKMSKCSDLLRRHLTQICCSIVPHIVAVCNERRF